MKVKRLIEEGGMDKLRRGSGSKLVTGGRHRDLSKRDYSLISRICILSILILLFFALTVSPGSSAPDPQYSFEGLDTKQGWQPANICCYLEGDCVPCHVIVDNTKPHAIAETLTEQIFFDYNSESDYSGTLGVVDLENFNLPPGGTTSGPFYNVIAGGVEIYYWWNYTIPADESWIMTFCARLSDECGLYPGASMHGRIEQGHKDISIKAPTSMPDLYATKSANVICDEISYTINYGNSGDADQTGTTLVDDYDETKVTVTSITGGGTNNDDTITWDLETVAVGASGSVSYTVSIKEGVANGAVIINSGTISGDFAEESTGDNDYSVTSNAKVSPTATAGSNSPVCEGDTIELYGGPEGMSSYRWTGPDAWNSNERNPTRPDATLAMAGKYTLTVTDANGCTDSDDVTVTVS